MKKVIVLLAAAFVCFFSAGQSVAHMSHPPSYLNECRNELYKAYYWNGSRYQYYRTYRGEYAVEQIIAAVASFPHDRGYVTENDICDPSHVFNTWNFANGTFN